MLHVKYMHVTSFVHDVAALYPALISLEVARLTQQ